MTKVGAKYSIMSIVSIVSTQVASKKASVKYFFISTPLFGAFTGHNLTDASNRAQPEVFLPASRQVNS